MTQTAQPGPRTQEHLGEKHPFQPSCLSINQFQQVNLINFKLSRQRLVFQTFSNVDPTNMLLKHDIIFKRTYYTFCIDKT